LDNIMPLNFGLLQPVDIGARFTAGQESVQRNQLAQQQREQDQEFNALRMQQMRGAVSQQERQAKTETATQKTAMFRDRLQRARDPNAVRELVKMQYADPDLGPILSQTGTLEQALAEVPDDPVQFERHRQQEIMGMSEWMKSQLPKVVGNAVYLPSTGKFDTPPENTSTPDVKTMQQLGYPITPQGYRDFRDAQRQERLLTPEEEKQRVRIANASRAPAQPVAPTINKVEQGKTQLADDLENLRASFETLDKLRAVPSTERGPLSNITSAIASSRVGQITGQAFATEAQVERDVINSARSRLVNSIKNATGMSAQQLNSNVELQTMLKSISDPGQSYQSAIRIIDDIEKAYVTGNGALPKRNQPAAAPAASAGGLTPAEQAELDQLRSRFGKK
jgi:hypothetical protein